MPVSRWLRWIAWARTQGPLGALGADYRHADLALRTSIVGKQGEERDIRDFLPMWRKPSDYLPWGIDLGPDYKPPEPVTD